MTVLKGAGGIQPSAWSDQSKKLGTEFVTTQATLDAVKVYQAKGVEPPNPAQEGAPPGAHQGVMKKEASFRSSPIDWSKYQALKNASRFQIDAAMTKFRALDHLDLDFQKLVHGLHFLGQGLEIEKLPDLDARKHYFEHVETLGLIGRIQAGLVAAGDMATADFPKEQLALLKTQLEEDLKTLLAVKGNGVTVPPPQQQFVSRGGGASMGGYGPAGADPTPNMLPAAKHVQAAHVQTIEDAAQIIGARLENKGLAAGLIHAAEKVPAAKKADFARLLGAYAILADEAVHAPDYQKDPMSWGPEHRQHYRARDEQKWESEHAGMRRQISRASLYAPLIQVQMADDPLRTLEKGLMKEFLREIGVPETASKYWAPNAVAVAQALEGEAFLPLRALNERAPHHLKSHALEMQQVVRSLTHAVVEGRFEEWRASHDASREQLSILSPEQREAWFKPVSVEHDITDKAGKGVKFKTVEPQGFEMFWATKVGGPSHGFDTMTQCLVPLLTNARNSTIVVEDPRWPNYAGRTYMRIVQNAKTNEPVLFIESSHRDFPYPGSQTETEKAILKHAIAKAKAMNIQLVFSGRCKQTIDELKLPVDSRNEKYRLAPSLINEAASVFGPHDWVQKEAEVRSASSEQLYFNRKAYEMKNEG